MIEMVPKPRIIRRTCGGYLAVAPKRARFQIGVTADTEAAAEHKFWVEYVAWCETVPLEGNNKNMRLQSPFAQEGNR